MDQIEKKILGLQQSGYEIRFPGGTGRGFSGRSSHASFGVIARTDGMATEILVVPYHKAKQNRDHEHDFFAETPEQTLTREIQEETGLLIRTYFEMHTKKVGDHVKHAFFVQEFDDSNLRRKVSPYQQEIGVPFWCSATLLEKYVSQKHKWIMLETLYYLRLMGKNIFHTQNQRRHKVSPIRRKPSALACL